MTGYTDSAKKLLSDQLNDWQLAAKNYSELKYVQVREFDFDGFCLKVQFNPARIISSAAKVDKQSIENRRCFLCAENRPVEQKQIEFGKYHILVNPFPIFSEHFTIPHIEHIPQLIAGRFGDMLDLAKALQGYTIFYNGPGCGASAPDHFHFQAGIKGFMPLENEIDYLKKNKATKISSKLADVWAINDGLRKFLYLESTNNVKLEMIFNSIYRKLELFNKDEVEEPLMNILACYDDETWQVFVFPRYKHRPWQYFEEGEKNIVLSPASVDLGGVFITPLEKDFRKISPDDITDIFDQVLWPKEMFDSLINQLNELK